MKIKLENATVYHGSNLDVLPTLPDNSVDSIVTDPPYELGFMGKSWDNSGIAYSVELWTECMRVLKPGGHLLAFGGSRTWHRLAVAIEDAGFEMRDSIAWLYGSGFPKSLDISKAIDKVNGDPNRLLKFTLWFRTTGITVKQVTAALRTAKLISENGTMASHYFAQSNAGQPAIPTAQMWQVIRPMISEVPHWVDELVERIEAEREVIGLGAAQCQQLEKTGVCDGHFDNGTLTVKHQMATAAATEEAKKWSGWGTALKPAFEPVVVARKPLEEKTVAANVLKYGTGGLNIDGSRIGSETVGWQGAGRSGESATAGASQGGEQGGYNFGNGEARPVQGRWPANIILDPYTAELLDEQSGISVSRAGLMSNPNFKGFLGTESTDRSQPTVQGHSDSGGASRFFYVAKASKKDRNEGLDELQETSAGEIVERKEGSAGMNSPRAGAGRTSGAKNFHPTVKPTALMEYLIKLVTPSGGTVLDPFTGSGSTGKAALLNGFKFIGIELTEEYLPIIEGRLKWASEQASQTEEEKKETLF